MRYKSRLCCLIGCLAVLLTVIIIIHCHLTFPIEADLSNLDLCIVDSYNRGYRIECHPIVKIHDDITLGNTKYALIEIDEKLGSVALTQNIIGRYKIDRFSYGDSNFRDVIVESGDKKYLLFGGRNIGLEIASCSFAFGGLSYSLDIPKKNTFFVCVEIDSLIDELHLDLEKFSLYNSQGENITKKVYSSGAGI